MPNYIVGTNSTFGGINLSDGVMTTATYRSRHVAARAITSLALTYINGVGTSENGTGTVTYKCAVEYNGVTTPVTFGGVRTVAVLTGAKVTTDQVSVVIPAGATFWVRTNVSVSAGQKWGLHATMTSLPNPPYGDGVTPNADTADAVGTMTNGASNSALVLPLAIANQDTTDCPSVVIFGDSIPTGGSDTQDSLYDLGYLVRALNRTPAGVGIPYSNLALGGETVNGIVLGAGTLRKAIAAAGGFRDVIVAYGTNDILALGRSVPQIEADLTSLYTTLSGYGLRVWGVTILPRTTSTDAWATTTNQTPQTGYAAGGVREQLNAWLRTMPAPLTGVIDVADAVESFRNSGVWKAAAPALTADGTHPTSAGSKLMAAVVPVSRFAAAPAVQLLS